MKKNMGNTDRSIRIIAAIVSGILYFTGAVTGVWRIALLVTGGLFILTSLAGRCMLYALVGINTCPLKKKKTSL